MANQDAAFGMRPARMVGEPLTPADKADTESPLTMARLYSKGIWLLKLLVVE